MLFRCWQSEDIVEVNQIFKDLATMVHEQGEVIDSIEANVETASIQVNEGTAQLSKARDYQVIHLTIHLSFYIFLWFDWLHENLIFANFLNEFV